MSHFKTDKIKKHNINIRTSIISVFILLLFLNIEEHLPMIGNFVGNSNFLACVFSFFSQAIHVMMVHRMIGNKPGTGGSSGVGYLHSTTTG